MPELNTATTDWNLGLLYAGDSDPKMDADKKKIEEASYAFINKWKNRTDYLQDPAVLKEALDEYEAWKRGYGSDGDIGYYFSLRHAQDESDPDIKAALSKIEDFDKRIQNDIQFFELKVSKIPKEQQDQFLLHGELRPYKHFLEMLFAASKYLLSEPEERILNLKSGGSYENWVRMTSSFLSKEEREVLLEDGSKQKKNFSEIATLMSSRQKAVRDGAALAFNEILQKHAEVAENEMNAVLKNKQIDDELRKPPSPDFLRHLSDDVDSGVVDALVDAVDSRLEISQRYYQLKAKLLGQPQLEYHERNVPYGSTDKKYPYPEAVGLVYRVLAGLDAKFASIFKDFVENGHLDVYPKKGKHSGAFCAYHLVNSPVFVLLNHADRLDDVGTMAHEMGHAINDELMREKQNALNFHTPTSTAEVASTFMEDFVLRELAREADDELRLALNMMKLDDNISSINRQVACYRFEAELHEQFRKVGYLSKEQIGELFQKHMSAYMGPGVRQPEEAKNWWIYWSHIRMFFYVYSYASGLLISKSLQNSVHQDHTFIEKVKEFLSAGGSDSPKNIFAKMGIDITDKKFWEKGMDEIENLLNETEELARKLGKV